jgi:hypothetical protein
MALNTAYWPSRNAAGAEAAYRRVIAILAAADEVGANLGLLLADRSISTMTT